LLYSSLGLRSHPPFPPRRSSDLLERPDPARDLRLQAHALGLRGVAHGVERALHQRGQVHGADVEVELARHDARDVEDVLDELGLDRKSTRLNSSHGSISYAVFCL